MHPCTTHPPVYRDIDPLTANQRLMLPQCRAHLFYWRRIGADPHRVPSTSMGSSNIFLPVIEKEDLLGIYTSCSFKTTIDLYIGFTHTEQVAGMLMVE